jgi:DNA replication protein DnaD
MNDFIGRKTLSELEMAMLLHTLERDTLDRLIELALDEARRRDVVATNSKES